MLIVAAILPHYEFNFLANSSIECDTPFTRLLWVASASIVIITLSFAVLDAAWTIVSLSLREAPHEIALTGIP